MVSAVARGMLFWSFGGVAERRSLEGEDHASCSLTEASTQRAHRPRTSSDLSVTFRCRQLEILLLLSIYHSWLQARCGPELQKPTEAVELSVSFSLARFHRQRTPKSRATAPKDTSTGLTSSSKSVCLGQAARRWTHACSTRMSRSLHTQRAYPA